MSQVASRNDRDNSLSKSLSRRVNGRICFTRQEETESRDALNQIPREIAVMRGFVDVAVQFMPQPGNVSMARFLKNRES